MLLTPPFHVRSDNRTIPEHFLINKVAGHVRKSEGVSLPIFRDLCRAYAQAVLSPGPGIIQSSGKSPVGSRRSKNPVAKVERDSHAKPNGLT